MATNNALIRRLDEIVCAQLDPEGQYLTEMKNGSVDELLQEIRRQLTELRLYLLDSVEGLSSSATLDAWVYHHASFASNLCQRLSKYYDRSGYVFKESRRVGYRQVLTKACGEIDTFLRFLQEQYGKYFDFDLLAPFVRVDQAVSNFKKRMDGLEKLYELEGTDPRVIDFALTPIRAMVKNGGSVSYRKLRYFDKILSKLEVILEGKPDEPNRAMHEALLGINFNQPQYIHYCIRRLQEKLTEQWDKKLDTPKSDKDFYLFQLQTFNWYIKAQNQVAVEDGVGLERNIETAVDQLNNYLTNEIAYLQTMIKLENGVLDGLPVAPKLKKIRLNASTKEAAVWLRSGMDSDYFKFENNEDAITMFCAHFSTVGTEDVSSKSFRPHFYNPGQAPVGKTIDSLDKQKGSVRGLLK
ncbi:hypothetical protein [Chitinophaga rhizosphaerae]|uniref:hypothetical protein n=1 Tax=Chitinophaga rhizosphaerae TaxID=1864947 RepID=UPI000F8054C3|nr:hypothetical protein [Chitinophaga rhizosphaerae]